MASRLAQRRSVAAPTRLQTTADATKPRLSIASPRSSTIPPASKTPPAKTRPPPAPTSTIPKPRPSTTPSSQIQRTATSRVSSAPRSTVPEKKPLLTRQATTSSLLKPPHAIETSSKTNKPVMRKTASLSTPALVLATARPIEAAAMAALQSSPTAKAASDLELAIEREEGAAKLAACNESLEARDAELAASVSELATKDAALAAKDATIAEFTTACARFKADCESYATTALNWKSKCEAAEAAVVVWQGKCEALTRELQHAQSNAVSKEDLLKPTMARRSSSSVLLRANAAWVQAAEGLEHHLADAETLIQHFHSDSDAPTSPMQRTASLVLPDTIAALDAQLQRMPLQLEDETMASQQGYERELFNLKKELRRLGEYVRSQQSVTLLEDEFKQYKLSTEEKLHRSHDELHSLRAKLLGLAKTHCEQMGEAVTRMNVLEDTIEALQAGAPVAEPDVAAWKVERDQLGATIASYERTHIELQAQLATLQASVVSMNEEKLSLTAQCSSLQSALASRKDVDGVWDVMSSTSAWVVDVLRAQLDQCYLQRTVYARGPSSSASSSARVRELEAQVRAVNATLQDRESQVRELESQVRDLEVVASANVDMENLQLQLDGQERQLTALRAQKHHESVESHARIVALELERDELESGARESAVQLQQLQKHIVSLTARYDQEQANSVQLDATLEAQQAHITALERTKATMATKMAQLERALALADKQHATHRQLLDRDHTASATLHLEIAHLKKQNDGLAQLLGRQEAALNDAHKNVADLEGQVERYQLQQVELDQYKHEVEAMEEILEASSPLHGAAVRPHVFPASSPPSPSAKRSLDPAAHVAMWRERCAALEGTNAALLAKLQAKDEPDIRFYVAQVDGLEERLGEQAAMYQGLLDDAQARCAELSAKYDAVMRQLPTSQDQST
ncbi:hypothetical protein SPRG_14909 [Saprolegnia parasitica CBS 223.65]|uniref:Uncharacterized protein n=1 Tax=Saprolegnia parasitica (strain CBS 223.65) TaxID=695850 RepID=A0A067BNQ8_SAPPC|nr:hypothetical protein SPRG_14909 [Saprolegnia parasitica CBS 223.65]KDO19878.1 hypothetical protein SPRG_14909 [Saprolegnia parasitica CBS 223.65]|eukprot:XP_012209435.1 hypothetical protein SPRG_14909 [Saprolegnia parasitica CBS 223.65]